VLREEVAHGLSPARAAEVAAAAQAGAGRCSCRSSWPSRGARPSASAGSAWPVELPRVGHHGEQRQASTEAKQEGQQAGKRRSSSVVEELHRGERVCIFAFPLSSDVFCISPMPHLLERDSAMHTAQ
jgi:hypothetical protein